MTPTSDLRDTVAEAIGEDIHKQVHADMMGEYPDGPPLSVFVAGVDCRHAEAALKAIAALGLVIVRRDDLQAVLTLVETAGAPSWLVSPTKWEPQHQERWDRLRAAVKGAGDGE